METFEQRNGVEQKNTEDIPHIESEQSPEDLCTEKISHLSMQQRKIEAEGETRLNHINKTIDLSPEKTDSLTERSGIKKVLQDIATKGKNLIDEMGTNLKVVAMAGIAGIAIGGVGGQESLSHETPHDLSIIENSNPVDNQEGGKTPIEQEKKKSESYITALGIKNEVTEHVRSKEYFERLLKEVAGDREEAESIQRERARTLENVKIEMLSLAEMKERFGKNDPNGAFVTGLYGGLNNNTVYFSYETDIAKGFNKEALQRTMRHEFLHASMGVTAYMTEESKQIFDASFDDKLKKDSPELNTYYQDHAERIARKQELDMEMDKLGIKKYGEEFTQKHYEKLIEYAKKGGLSRHATEFLKTTKPEYFEKIFNKIAAEQEDKKDSFV